MVVVMNVVIMGELGYGVVLDNLYVIIIYLKILYDLDIRYRIFFFRVYEYLNGCFVD